VSGRVGEGVSGRVGEGVSGRVSQLVKKVHSASSLHTKLEKKNTHVLRNEDMMRWRTETSARQSSS
jgi:hypothetical protein